MYNIPVPEGATYFFNPNWEGFNPPEPIKKGKLHERQFYTDPETGGTKEVKRARFDLIPPDVLWKLAEHYGYGAEKYEDRNWEKGYPWSLSYTAAQRHLHSWYMRESYDNDPGAPPGTHHLIAGIWHLIACLWFELHEKGTDDRPYQVHMDTRTGPGDDNRMGSGRTGERKVRMEEDW